MRLPNLQSFVCQVYLNLDGLLYYLYGFYERAVFVRCQCRVSVMLLVHVSENNLHILLY
jgi:hypothetical protein